MDVMKSGVLLVAPLQRIPRQPIPAMVVHALHDADGAEEHGLPDRKAREHEGEGGTDGIEQEGFGEGVVEGAEGVGDVDLVVVRVDVACFFFSNCSVYLSLPSGYSDDEMMRMMMTGGGKRKTEEGHMGFTYGTSIYWCAWRDAKNTASCR